MPSRPAETSGFESTCVYVGQTLNLDILLSIAWQNNPTLRQAQAHITAETGKAIQAGLYTNVMARQTYNMGQANAAEIRQVAATLEITAR